VTLSAVAREQVEPVVVQQLLHAFQLPWDAVPAVVPAGCQALVNPSTHCKSSSMHGDQTKKPEAGGQQQRRKFLACPWRMSPTHPLTWQKTSHLHLLHEQARKTMHVHHPAPCHTSTQANQNNGQRARNASTHLKMESRPCRCEYAR
jgi:hypothetical protein